MDNNEKKTWVLASISKNIYAISCQSVFSLFQLNKLTPLPSSSENIKGVIDYQGKVIQLIDIKRIFNLTSTHQEIEDFRTLMELRKQDHIKWLKNLENSVLQKTEFTLTTDPHKCAFGKWYDSYDVQNDNIIFMSTFGKFDAPHKAIHEIAIKAKALIDRGDNDGAINLVESTKNNELQQMMYLFDELKNAYEESKKEIVVVLGNKDNSISIAVDEVVAIEELVDFDSDLLKDTISNSDYISGIAKRKTGQPVFLLNDEYLLDKYRYKKK